ncbi:MAG TPA: hypothetical protein VEP89_00175 [Draconibacterium sp.]|nr:hypothetical protein [Draconibacterium sp.]
MKNSIQINCFAGLRKYFTASIEMNLTLPAAYEDVIQEMKKMNPEASEILNNCRIAVHEKFVSMKSQINGEEAIYLIPPSSGG